MIIRTVREGVTLRHDAATMFELAEKAVMERRGYGFTVNSSFRSYGKQLSMHLASVAYENGVGPYPGHSRAVHPDESFHTTGLALDLEDWDDAIVQEEMARHGFIRNRLHIPNERHHFEFVGAVSKDVVAVDETEEEELIYNIQGKAEVRLGGAYVVKGGKSYFLGGVVTGVPVLDFNAGTAFFKLYPRA